MVVFPFMAQTTPIEDAAYKAGDHYYSIQDLMRSAVSPEYISNGLPRISDFHLKVGAPVCFRLDDRLQSIAGGENLTPEVIERLIFPLLTEAQIKLLQENASQDLDCSYELKDGDSSFNFRLNVFRDRDGLAAVIRLLPPEIPDLIEIGFPSDNIWMDIVNLKQGLVLFTGVTSSGKSTTIASLLEFINRNRAVRIITLEDPVEYVFKNQAALISQREVGTHVASFSRGLVSVLRENPDIIFVGEMRDPETTALAMTAAETGHLVFSTLHTRDAIGALTRIIDMFPPERTKELTTQLSFSLAYVASQKLIPRADGNGRCVAMEILKNSSGVPNLIRTAKWHQIYSVMETRSAEGMITMEQCLIDMVKQGQITAEQAILHANREEIEERLKKELR